MRDPGLLSTSFQCVWSTASRTTYARWRVGQLVLLSQVATSQIQHCLHWAKEHFDNLFKDRPTEVNTVRATAAAVPVARRRLTTCSPDTVHDDA